MILNCQSHTKSSLWNRSIKWYIIHIETTEQTRYINWTKEFDIFLYIFCTPQDKFKKTHSYQKLTKATATKTRILLRENSQQTRKKCSQFIDHNSRSAWLVSLVLIQRHINNGLAHTDKFTSPNLKFTFIQIEQSIVLSFEKDLVRSSSIKLYFYVLFGFSFFLSFI